MVPAYQICGVVCSSFGNLCAVEHSCFGVLRDQICHSNSQPMVA